MSQDVISFVLRFVRDASDQQDARWRGSVKHVQGATERQFTQFSEALAFIQSQLNHAAWTASESRAAVRAANPWLETAKLWGEFVPQMNRIVLESMGGLSSASPADEALEAKLDALAEQLEHLSSAVEQLQGDIHDFAGRTKDTDEDGRQTRGRHE